MGNQPGGMSSGYQPGGIKSPAMIQIENDIARITNQIRDENNVINNERPRLIDEKNKLRSLEDQLNALYEKLRNTKNTSQSEYDRLRSQISQLKLQRSICISNLSVQKGIISGQTKKITDMLNQISALDKKYQDLNNKKILNDAQISLDNLEIKRISNIISSLKKTINRLNKTLNNQNLDLAELNNYTNDLNNLIRQLILKDYSNKVYNSENILALSENIDSSLNRLFTNLKKQNKTSEYFYEKIKYRDIEHEQLANKNKLLDILFYSLFFSFIIIIVCTRNINREHFLIYIFIGLIPFIYPLLFKYIKYLFNYISNKSHGPKNAFIDINNTIYASKL